jgi:LemA protein
VTPVELAAAFAVGLLVAIAGYLAFATYNAVVALRYRIDKAWSNIDVVLKQRFDQLPNLVEAVRGLMAWEQAVLVEVTEARAAYSPTAPIPDQAATSVATSSAIRSLFATVERYPEVRSAANVMALQEEIERLEAMIADRRELYNDQVYLYNTRIAQVPAVLLATLFGWRARPFFTATDGERARPTAGLGTGEAEAAADVGAEAGTEVPRG